MTTAITDRVLALCETLFSLYSLEGDAIIILVLLKRKLRHREMKQYTHGHVAVTAVELAFGVGNWASVLSTKHCLEKFMPQEPCLQLFTAALLRTAQRWDGPLPVKGQ